MQVNFKKISEINLEQIINFVNTSEDAWLDHHPLYWGLYGDISHSFALIENGLIKCICIFALGRLGYTDIMTGPGFAFQNNPSKYLLKECKRHLYQIATDLKISAIYWMRPPETNISKTFVGFDPQFDVMGFCENFPWAGVSHFIPARSVILEYGTDVSCFSNITKGHKSAYSRACKMNNLDFVIFEGDRAVDMIDVFLLLQDNTFFRTTKSPYPQKNTTALVNMLISGFAKLAFVKLNDEFIATAFVMVYKDCARYYAGGSNKTSLEIGGSVFLHISISNYLSDHKFKSYNMGSYFPTLSSGKMKQIGDFKKSFGGTKYRIVSGLLITNPPKFFWLGILVVEIKSLMIGLRNKLRNL